MDVSGAQIHPVPGGYAVSKAVAGARQLSHFGVAGRARSKEHLHDVRAERTSSLHQTPSH